MTYLTHFLKKLKKNLTLDDLHSHIYLFKHRKFIFIEKVLISIRWRYIHISVDNKLENLHVGRVLEIIILMIHLTTEKVFPNFKVSEHELSCCFSNELSITILWGGRTQLPGEIKMFSRFYHLYIPWKRMKGYNLFKYMHVYQLYEHDSPN